ncbi:hypothetical protein R5O20_02770 [Tenacibaculum maritimum]|uniref:hypothetical protein n=2 Tax=Tenacibaculum maritimum TaxID=107401 RepID=UPI00132FD435|nr:hypothetical protein [Tenacibaculum maritimum]
MKTIIILVIAIILSMINIYLIFYQKNAIKALLKIASSRVYSSGKFQIILLKILQEYYHENRDISKRNHCQKLIEEIEKNNKIIRRESEENSF